MRTASICIMLLVLPAALAAQSEPARSQDRATIEHTIRASIGWALTRDRALLESVITHEDDLFIFHPDSKSTVAGWAAFAKNFELWLDPRFKATSFDVRDLRVTFARNGEVAWFAGILDDFATWEGRPIGWKDARWTGVLEKRGGVWVIVQMHFSLASDRLPAAD